MNNHEINKFNNLAHEWWNIDGEFRTLHQINPARVEFIKSHINLIDKKVIDVGCGGGILSESMAKAGANVTAVDLAPQSIEVAKLHLYESNLNIDYQCVDISNIAINEPISYDVVTCMELLEHVCNVDEIISNCAKLIKTGGLAFFSTINKNPKSYLLGVLIAEYVFKLIPKGTHDYKKFITPANLQQILYKHDLLLIDIKGLHYNPLTQIASISQNVDINYMVCCVKV